MLASVLTRASVGLNAPLVTVEVHASNGLPTLSIVGLPEASVRESKERVRSALISSGFQLPPKRITVNLAPADLPKSGGRYDLAIAIGILVATEQLSIENLAHYEFYGELGLTGELRSVPGVLSALVNAEQSHHTAIIPTVNSSEAQVLLSNHPTESSTTAVLVAPSLLEVCGFLLNRVQLESIQIDQAEPFSYANDLADISGQLQAKRVLELSASGGHSLLMVGPPGSGKSMLASRLVTLLPELNQTQALELASIYSVAGKAVDVATIKQIKLVSPHHSASTASMVGGGSVPKPGAITLAHNGVLFLDELPEFTRPVLEALREPLETHQVEVTRVQQQVTFPAKFLLVSAMNPSPSGYFPDDPFGRCSDTPDQIARYQRKISGPLLDRIDLHLEVPPVDIDSLQKTRDPLAENSETVRARVVQIRNRQMSRQGCLNSELSPSQIAELIQLDEISQALLKNAVDKMGISARSYHRILRIARTLADMENSPSVESSHIAEALGYRSLDRKFGNH
ncbi:MAG: YifB family Mg chelatase-like AAA ATPase [Pseudomonadota bacterium]|nr:YifB family Mg chelatase-like AAA ATPase [Pseudomonadota bacterium]